MIVIANYIEDIQHYNFIKNNKQVQFIKASDLRWHKTRFIDDSTIIFLPEIEELNYLVYYVQLISNANIIIISKDQSKLSKKLHGSIIWLDPEINDSFFQGVLYSLNHSSLLQQKNKTKCLSSMNMVRYALTNIDQISVLADYLGQAARKPNKLSHGIFELLLNAFEHGVYQLGYNKKQSLINDKNYFSELNRLKQETNDKKIELIFHKKESEIYININDPGMGFDYAPYLQFSPKNENTVSGRGIAFAANFCFDKLVFKNNGSHVFAILSNHTS